MTLIPSLRLIHLSPGFLCTTGAVSEGRAHVQMTQSGSTPGHFRITWLFQKAQVLGRSQQLCLTLWGIVRGALALLFLKADSTVPLPGVPLTQARATSHFSPDPQVRESVRQP